MTIPAPLAVQLYSLRREAADDLPGVLTRVAAMGYVGVEPAGLHGHAATSVRQMLDDLGLVAATAHMPLPEGSDADPILEEASILGVRTLISGERAEAFATVADVARTAERFAAAADAAAPYDIEMGYHNHWWEFDHTVDGATAHAAFMSRTDPRVVAEVDLYWAAVAGADVAAALRDLGPRLRALHVKDGPATKDAPQTAVGDGTLPIAEYLRAGAAADWHIVELDECATDMETAVARSLAHLTATGLSRARIAAGQPLG